MTKKELKKQAFPWFQKLRLFISNYRTFTLERAEMLYWGNKRKYHEVLGYDSWFQFIHDPDLQLSSSQDARDRRIYEKFILELKVPKAELYSINFRRLEYLIPRVKLSNLDEWLSKARVLSEADFIKEIKGMGNPMTCGHENQRSLPAKTICEDCGERL